MVRRAPLLTPVLAPPQVYQARWSNITVAAKVLVDMQRGAMHEVPTVSMRGAVGTLQPVK